MEFLNQVIVFIFVGLIVVFFLLLFVNTILKSVLIAFEFLVMIAKGLVFVAIASWEAVSRLFAREH